MIFRNYRHRPKTLSWANRPFPANGLVVRFEPLVAGQPYFYMEGDGQFWRPLCGAQVLYTLGAEIVFTQASGYQLAVSIPLYPGLLVDARSMLRSVTGIDKFGGVTDTFTVSHRIGVNVSAADPVPYNSAMAAANISSGTTNQCSRVTSTTLRKHGSGAAGSNVALSGVSTVARAAEIIVADMDTTTNYYSLFGSLGTGDIGEYGVLHSFTLELIG